MTVEQRAKALHRAAEMLEGIAGDERRYRKSIELHDAPENERRSREREHAATYGAEVLRREIRNVLGFGQDAHAKEG